MHKDATVPAHKDAVAPDKPTDLGAASDDRKNQRNLPVESPRPKPLPQLSPLLNSAHSDRSLPPLPASNLLTLTQPLAIPESKHNVPNLHLDLSDLQSPISPSIYPPTSHLPSPAATGSLVSPGTYPTYASGSYFVASPTSMTATPASSCPSSPSIANLSQLSVVRHRLAQIERNHSHLSSQSVAPPRITPLPSPASSSGWSKSEALFRNTGPKTPSRLRPTSPAEDRPVIIPQSHNKSRQVDEVNTLQDVLATHDSKSSASKEDIRKLSRGLADLKGVIGGESGHPTVHQMVLALEHHARGEKKALRNIQDSLAMLGDHVADAVASAPHENVKATQIDGAVVMENNEKVMEALKEVKERLAVDFPALSSKLEEMHKLQVRIGTNNEVASTSSLAAAQDSSTAFADLKLVFDKLEEIRVLCNSSKQGELNRGGEAETTKVGPCIISCFVVLTPRTKHVEKILSLVQEDGNKQTILSQQQADSVRYLNELNSVCIRYRRIWLRG